MQDESSTSAGVSMDHHVNGRDLLWKAIEAFGHDMNQDNASLVIKLLSVYNDPAASGNGLGSNHRPLAHQLTTRSRSAEDRASPFIALVARLQVLGRDHEMAFSVVQPNDATEQASVDYLPFSTLLLLQEAQYHIAIIVNWSDKTLRLTDHKYPFRHPDLSGSTSSSSPSLGSSAYLADSPVSTGSSASTSDESSPETTPEHPSTSDQISQSEGLGVGVVGMLADVSAGLEAVGGDTSEACVDNDQSVTTSPPDPFEFSLRDSTSTSQTQSSGQAAFVSAPGLATAGSHTSSATSAATDAPQVPGTLLYNVRTDGFAHATGEPQVDDLAGDDNAAAQIPAGSEPDRHFKEASLSSSGLSSSSEHDSSGSGPDIKMGSSSSPGPSNVITGQREAGLGAATDLTGADASSSTASSSMATIGKIFIPVASTPVRHVMANAPFGRPMNASLSSSRFSSSEHDSSGSGPDMKMGSSSSAGPSNVLTGQREAGPGAAADLTGADASSSTASSSMAATGMIHAPVESTPIRRLKEEASASAGLGGISAAVDSTASSSPSISADDQLALNSNDPSFNVSAATQTSSHNAMANMATAQATLLPDLPPLTTPETALEVSVVPSASLAGDSPDEPHDPSQLPFDNAGRPKRLRRSSRIENRRKRTRLSEA